MRNDKKTRGLTYINVAALYVGTIMGAGFASGREGWQFFGVFGMKGYAGLTIATVLFAVIGMIISYIAATKGTDDVATIIMGEKHPVIGKVFATCISLMLYPVIISMSAAGGSFLNQQFGFHRAVGAAIIIFLVIITIIGDFERISKVFKKIVPALFIIDVGLCIIVSFSDIGQSGATDGFAVSNMAPNWLIASIVFVTYNAIALAPLLGTSAINARDRKNAVVGAGLGGLLLGILTIVLVTALRKDMAFSDSMDLPMLAYSARIGKVANILFGGVLFAAIYSAATSVFYGFTVMIPEGPKKKPIIVATTLLGFLGSLTGFKVIVSFLYPFEGYIGLVIIACIVVNFFSTLKEEISKEKKLNKNKEFSSSIYVDFPEHDRFGYPDNIVRVTAGFGGESLLIFGEEKIALYDCGMAYCHKGLIDNIHNALRDHGREKIDYVLISHTHYDHIGALPYILEEYPDTVVCGAEKSKSVFKSEGARKTMKRLGEAARDIFTGSGEPITTDGLRVDRIVKDGDEISLGNNQYIRVLETKGHTDCSLTFVLEPDSIMFACESTGVLRNPELMHTAVLKNFNDTLESADKCAAYGAKHVIGPHYGIVPDSFVDEYFRLYKSSAIEERDYILYWYDRGLSFGELMAKYEEKYWSPERGKAQPKPAFMENAKYTIKHIVEVYRK